MTQNEKDLLLKDLCARLPYNTKFRFEYVNPFGKTKHSTSIMTGIRFPNYIEYHSLTGTDYLHIEKNVVKPYLFPMSSMTEEQRCEYHNNCDVGLTEWGNELYYDCAESFDWLNAHHFDYRGLIPMGLANDATGLNIY